MNFFSKSCLLFASCRKLKIRQFRVMVVQRRQRNVHKIVKHVPSCCFAKRELIKQRRQRRQRERQKSNRLIGKTTTLHVHHAFFYISLPYLHDYDVKMPNFTFCGGREHKKTISFFFRWTLIQSFRIQLQKTLPTLNELNEME